MKKHISKSAVSLSLILFSAVVVSPIVAEISRKEERLQSEDVKGNVELIIEGSGNTGTSEAAKQEKKELGFFQKLFKRSAHDAKQNETIEEPVVADTVASGNAKATEAETNLPEKRMGLAQRLFGLKNKKAIEENTPQLGEVTKEPLVEPAQVETKPEESVATKVETPEQENPPEGKKMNFLQRLFSSHENDKQEAPTTAVDAPKEVPVTPPMPTDSAIAVEAKDPVVPVESATAKEPEKVGFWKRLFSKEKNHTQVEKEVPLNNDEAVKVSTAPKQDAPEKSEQASPVKPEMAKPLEKTEPAPVLAETALSNETPVAPAAEVNLEESLLETPTEKGKLPVFVPWLKRKFGLLSGLKPMVVKQEDSSEPVPVPMLPENEKVSEQVKEQESVIASEKAAKGVKKTSTKESAKVAYTKENDPFHDTSELRGPKYLKETKPVLKDSTLGVVGEIEGKKVGPFERPGKYELSGTQTGLLLPISDKDELNTKANAVAVIMKQPALMSVDSYSSLSAHKVITINEIILKRGRFRLKTLDNAGLWTIRGREMMLSLASNTDVVFDLTGTLITKVFVLEGKAHCLPKLGEKPIDLEAGQMFMDGLSDSKVSSIEADQIAFLNQHFNLSSEEELSEKLMAAGVFKSRLDKNWPYDSKIYSGILCTNCSYAFDSRENYFDVCPSCHVKLMETPEPTPQQSEATKAEDKNSFKMSRWFFGIKTKSERELKNSQKK